MSNINSQNQTDVAIVGGGIVGLSHAMAAAKRGLSVTVFERTDKAEAASVRNFGMIWPIGVPTGPLHEAALVGRRMWIELAAAAGFWLSNSGAVFIAREPDELAVFEEYLSTDRAQRADCALLTRGGLYEKCPGARGDGLLGGLWSPLELAVDPRETIVAITHYLRSHLGVQFEFGAMVTEIESPTLRHLGQMIDIPLPRIAQRWHGIYPRHASLAQFVHSPQPGVTIVLNTNGMGMTLSFGLAEKRWDGWGSHRHPQETNVER